MKTLNDLTIKLFADTASLSDLAVLINLPYIRGFTTNPTLMRKAGVGDYRTFVALVLPLIPANKPISFEVFADNFAEMERQAEKIASWGKNVYVKIPVTTTSGDPTYSLISRLLRNDIKVNVTAVMHLDQIIALAGGMLRGSTPSYVSVFAGRIADTGRDPVPIMAAAVELLRDSPQTELIWASPRELLNVFQADAIGCHILTATPEILAKIPHIGKPLDQLSLDTVQMFHTDAQASGFTL